jgi:[FeFe] hydrogenase H-cluster maturation GTPase HydF
MNVAKSERVHICLFGRINVGKSSIINFIAGQNVSIVSQIAGTTTDVVEKTMEIAEIGAVVLIDTAGINDNSELGQERKKRTIQIFQKCDFACLVIEPNIWTEFENDMIENFRKNNIKFAITINKIDLQNPTDEFLQKINSFSENLLTTNTVNALRDDFLNKLKQIISKEITQNEKTLLDDLVQNGDVCLFVTPIDTGAPKGRLIMPQVQAIRNALDKNAISIIVQTNEYQQAINSLKSPPKIVICDSQVVKEVIELSKSEQAITTFSILFARLKGDFDTEIQGAYSLAKIKNGDKILIAEACSHHSQKDDIATVKIPKLLAKFFNEKDCNFSPIIEYSNGRDFPENLTEYKLIIHCGACMLTHKEKNYRIQQAINSDVPITNFGMAISFLNGYLDRVLLPFEIF